MIPGEFLISGYLRRLGQIFGSTDAPASTAVTNSSPTVDVRPAAPLADDGNVSVCGGTPVNVCGGSNAAPISSSGHPLFAAPQADPNATPLDRALAQAGVARQNNDESQFRFWSQQALTEARALPNADAIAVPMVQADLAAIGGDFVGASRRYAALEASLSPLARTNPDAASAVETIRTRHRGILAAGIGTAATAYAREMRDVNPAGALRWQRMATACADELYRMEPTEANLQTVLAAYAQVGLDLRAVRLRISGNEERIRNLTAGQVAPAIAPGGNAAAAELRNGGADPFGLNQAPLPGATIEMLQAQNQAGRLLVERTEEHLLGLIRQANPDEYQRRIQFSTALVVMGNERQGLVQLKQARTLFQAGRVERTPQNIATEVTVLHRLVGITGIDYDYQDGAIREARGLITTLGATDRDQATLLTIENMELQAQVNAGRGAFGLHNPGATSDEQEAAVARYQDSLREGQMAIVRYCDEALGRTTDAAARSRIGDRMFEARSQVLELDLGRALMLHGKDEKEQAATVSSQALREFDDFEASHRDVASPQGYRESMGRARLAQAHYEFRTGKIEEAIRTLHGVTDAYFDSRAAGIVRSQGGWPHQMGITGDDGEFRNTDQADVLAAVKTAAAQLNKSQGRGLAMCGVGAAAFVVADLALGEKVSGAAVAAGCVTGYLLDRAALVLEASNEIAAAYRTGATYVSTQDAVVSAGWFALNLASMYVGGAAGGLAERAVLAGGSRLGMEMTGFLVSRGLTPGPWTRIAGGILLRESAYAANAYAFHATSGAIQRTAVRGLTGTAPSPTKGNTARDYLVSWLFVRFMPLAMEANPGGRLITGTGRWDVAAQRGINTLAGIGAIQGIQALAMRDPKQISLDKMGGMAIDFLAMHHGNEALGTVLPMDSVRDLSARLDAATLRNMQRIRTDIENAPPPNDGWGGFGGGMQPAFAFAGRGRGGGAAAMGSPGEFRPFRLPGSGSGFNPVLMMSASDPLGGNGDNPGGASGGPRLPKLPTAKPRNAPASGRAADPLGDEALRMLSDRGGVTMLAGSPDQVRNFFRTEYGEDNFHRIEFLFSNDAVSRARTAQLRTRVAERLDHRYADLNTVRGAIDAVLREEGINLSSWRDARVSHYQETGDSFRQQQVELMHKEVLLGVLGIQLMPDEMPLYRSTESRHAGQSGETGSSWWGVGDSGMSVASSYASAGRILMRTTMGDLRRSGVVRSDEVAVTGNALELYHWTAPNSGGPSGDSYVPFRYEEIQPPALHLSLDGLTPERRRQVDAVLAGRDVNSLSFGDQKDLALSLTRNHAWSVSDLEGLMGKTWVDANMGYNEPGIDLSFIFAD